MRLTWAALVLALAAPAPAAAAPFGELPFRPVSGAATCLRPTGAPGELVRWVDGGAEVLTATPRGLVPTARVRLGRLGACPVMAADASGAGVLVGTTAAGLRVALREPGGAWGTPVTIAASGVFDLEAAVSARGDAVVGWSEWVAGSSRVSAVRRAAGGGFGASQDVVGRRMRKLVPRVRVGVASSGEAVLALTVPKSERSAESNAGVSIAPPGAPFPPPTTLEPVSASGQPVLAVAADGRALVAFTGGEGLPVYDREPGLAFGPRQLIAGSGEHVSVALGPGRTAVAAWQAGPGRQVGAVVRDGLTPFGTPVVVKADEQDTRFQSVVALGATPSFGGPPSEYEPELRAALGADGRALLVWGTLAHRIGTATVTPSGRTELGTIGGPVRDAMGLSPLLLADGSRALAWSDDRSPYRPGPYAGRLHLALDGAAALPQPRAPRVVHGAPRDRSLRPAQALVLPVRCSAACDVRASIRGRDDDDPIVASLRHAGRLVLRFEQALALKRAGPLTIDLRSGAPGALAAQRQTFSVRLTRLPVPPFPRIENLRARRRGGRVVVRWSTDLAARDVYFAIWGTADRASELGPADELRALRGSGHRSFHVTLRNGAHARFVRVTVGQWVGSRSRTETVRVR